MSTDIYPSEIYRKALQLETKLAEARLALLLLLGDPYMQEGISEDEKLQALLRAVMGKCNPGEAKALLRWRETRDRLADAVAVLREVEWVQLRLGSPFCPRCLTHTRHAPDCRLAKVIA